MTILKTSFKLKLFASVAYYALIVFLAIEFVPGIFSRVENFLYDISPELAAILAIVILIAGVVIACYAIVIPLVFLLESNYEDESLNQV